MEVLRKLHGTIDEDLRLDLDEPDQQLMEFGLRNVKERECQVEFQLQQEWDNQVFRIEYLERQNAELQQQQEHFQSDTRSSTEETTRLEEKLLDKQREHAPGLIIQNFSSETEEPTCVPYECYSQLAGRYQDLFLENKNLIQAFSTANASLRNCKAKVALWTRYLES